MKCDSVLRVPARCDTSYFKNMIIMMMMMMMMMPTGRNDVIVQNLKFQMYVSNKVPATQSATPGPLRGPTHLR